jgi:hypothetical protein
MYIIIYNILIFVYLNYYILHNILCIIYYFWRRLDSFHLVLRPLFEVSFIYQPQVMDDDEFGAVC